MVRCSLGCPWSRVEGVRAGPGAKTYTQASSSSASLENLPASLCLLAWGLLHLTVSSLFPQGVPFGRQDLCICPSNQGSCPTKLSLVLPNYMEESAVFLQELQNNTICFCCQTNVLHLCNVLLSNFMINKITQNKTKKSKHKPKSTRTFSSSF